MAIKSEALYSSRSEEWESPPDLIEKLRVAFPFTLDACDSRPNVCETYYTKQQDGLSQPWQGIVWCNPPYGKDIRRWMQKARLSAVEGTVVLCLVHSRTDTRWWHENVGAASMVVFVRGRLRFGGSPNSAPFPSALVAFGELLPEQRRVLSSCGMACVVADSPFAGLPLFM